MALTDRTIRNAKPAEKPRRLFDERGLYLEVAPSGGKLWRWKYRWAGREKRLALGTYPAVSLHDARERRDKARKQLSHGTDPSEVKRAEKAARTGTGTFEAIAREWHAKFKSKWVDEHADRKLRRLEADVFPWIGRHAVDAVTATELLTALRRIEARGAIETAHRVRSICGQVFRYAVASGRAERDPSVDLRGALSPVAEKHFASVTESPAIRGVLLAIDAYQGSLVVRCALQLQALLFVRPGELRHMRWADIDEGKAEWRFTASKTQTPHIVPLSVQALALLAELRPLTGAGTFVLPVRTASRAKEPRPMSNNTVNAALRRAGIDTKNELTGHGWRAAARTVLEEQLGFRPEVIELQLAHAVKDPLGRAYNRTTHIEERTRMMQAWANHLDGLRKDNVLTGHFRRQG